MSLAQRTSPQIPCEHPSPDLLLRIYAAEVFLPISSLLPCEVQACLHTLTAAEVLLLFHLCYSKDVLTFLVSYVADTKSSQHGVSPMVHGVYFHNLLIGN